MANEKQPNGHDGPEDKGDDLHIRFKTLEDKIEAQTVVIRDGFDGLGKSFSQTLTDLSNALVGKDQMPVKVTMLIVKTLCWAFGAIIILLTGLKSLLPYITH